jgi:hypothetical protein
MPAPTRSMIRLRLGSAITPMITTMARPRGAEVFSEADVLNVELVQLIEHFEELFDLTVWSDAQTKTTSNRPRRASIIIRSSLSRFAFPAEIVSSYCCRISGQSWWPSDTGRGTEIPDADRRSKPSYIERRFPPAPFFRFR